MSRIGQKPIEIPSGVDVSISAQTATVKGPKGELTYTMPVEISATVDGSMIKVERADDARQSRSFHGLVRSLLANMVEGVSQGYVRELEIQGVGFRSSVKGQNLTLLIGYSNPIEYVAPEGVTIQVTDNTRIAISGADKQAVGQAAARIRSYYPAEPYKGKGIRYKGEHVRRKVGKTVT